MWPYNSCHLAFDILLLITLIRHWADTTGAHSSCHKFFANIRAILRWSAEYLKVYCAILRPCRLRESNVRTCLQWLQPVKWIPRPLASIYKLFTFYELHVERYGRSRTLRTRLIDAKVFANPASSPLTQVFSQGSSLGVQTLNSLKMSQSREIQRHNNWNVSP